MAFTPLEQSKGFTPLAEDDSSYMKLSKKSIDTSKIVGAGEAGLNALTMIPAGVAGALRGIGAAGNEALSGLSGKGMKRENVEGAIANTMEDFTYAPRTEEGQSQSEKLNEILGYVLMPMMGHMNMPHSSRGTQKRIFNKAMEQVRKEGLDIDKATLEQAIKDKASALPKREKGVFTPLDYEHTTAPKEEPVLQTPQVLDHKGLNYEGGVDMPLMSLEEFAAAGGKPEAYKHYLELAPKEDPTLSLVPKEILPEQPKGLTPEMEAKASSIPPLAPMERPMEVARDNTIPFEKVTPEELRTNQSALDMTNHEEISYRKNATPEQGVDHVNTLHNDLTDYIKGQPGQFDLPGINNAISRMGGVGKKQGGAISPELFASVFKDFDASKIKDELGKLVPLFHGGEAIDKGMPNKGFGLLGDGLYLTDRGSRASGYAYGKNIKNGTVYQAYANIKNPLSFDDFVERFGGGLKSREESKAIADTLKAEGFDGIIRGDGKNKHWEVLSLYPDRDVKSAISPVRDLNLGRVSKQGGSVNFGISKAIVDLFKKDEDKPIERPAVIMRDRPATMRKDDTVKDLKAELLTETPEGLRRNVKDMSVGETLGSALQPGMHRQHPIRQFVYGKILKMNQEAANLAEDLMYGTEFKGFHKWRSVPIMERTSKGGLTDLDRIVKTNPESADKIFTVLQRYEGLRTPTEAELIRDGLNEREVRAVGSLRTMLDKIQEQTGVEKKAGYLPHMWTGGYRAWVTDKATGEQFVVGATNKWTKLKYNTDKYDVTVTKVDDITPLGDVDFGSMFKVIDATGLRDALHGRLADLIAEQGFKSHAKFQSGIEGYLGSMETTPKARAEARLKSLKMYVGSASRFIAKQGPAKDILDFQYDRDLADKYPVATKQANLDWSLATGNLYDIGKAFDGIVDNVSQATYGGSVADLKAINRGIASLGTRAKVLMFNVGNLIANKLQPILAIQHLNLEPGSVSKATVQGMKDYVGLRNNKELIPFIIDMEKRGVVSTAFLKELQNPSVAERRSMGETDAYLYNQTPKEKAFGVAEELSLQKETERTEIQSRLQAALIGKRFYENLGLSAKEVNDRVEAFVQLGMGDYDSHGKAPIFTNAGLAGDIVSPLSTFSTNELNKNLTYMKGTIRGSAKRAHAKALFGYSLAALTMAGLAGSIYTKTVDSFIELYNKLNPDDPIRTISDEVLANDKIPEAGKVGFVSAVTRAGTEHGVSVQGSLAQPTAMGGISLNTPFGLSFGWGLADLGTSITSDLLRYGHMTDETSVKAEKVAPPMLAGILDVNRTEDNGGMSVTNKMQGRYDRSPEEQSTRSFGLRSLDEQRQMAIDRSIDSQKKRDTASQGVLQQSIATDLINSKAPDEKQIQKFISHGGDFNTLINEVIKYKMDKKTTMKQREFLDGLSKQEIQLEQEVEDIREQEPQ